MSRAVGPTLIPLDPGGSALLIPRKKTMSQAKRLPARAHANGKPVQDLLCWSWLKETCSGGCGKLHLVPRPCYIDVDRFLWHSPTRCDGSHRRCNGVHRQDSDIRTQVLEWLCTELGPSAPSPPQWHDTAAPIDVSDWLPLLPANITAAATTDFTAAVAPKWARKKRSIDYVLNSDSVQENIYLAEFSRVRWLDRLVADRRFDRLLSGGQAALAKEITEAFAVTRLVREQLKARLRTTAPCPSTPNPVSDHKEPLQTIDRCYVCAPCIPANPPSTDLPIIDDGDGVLILDLCSGRGVTGTLMALEWPAAQVHMIDLEKTGVVTCVQEAVSALPNLSYHVHDLFASDLAPRIEALISAMQTRRATAAASREATDLSGETSEYSPTRPTEANQRTAAITTILIGTHLCGTLSPRLIELYLTIPGADAMILSPCCLKGALGNRVKDLASLSAARHSAARQVDAASPVGSMQHELELAQVNASSQQPSGSGRHAHPKDLEATIDDGEKQADSGGGDSNAVSLDAYTILCATLADMIPGAPGSASGRPIIIRDANVLSPKNGFIVAHKPRVVTPC